MTLRRSLAISTVEKYTTIAVNIGSTVVLARLLTPAEIGIYSVAAAVAGFAHILRDFGVTNYLIQEPDLTSERIRSALSVTCAIAWTFSVLLALLGPLVADFYGEPGLADVLLVVALSFAILPLSSTIIAVLRREMRFGALFAINVTGILAHAVTAISLAATGHGFMSLAWASFANVAATACMATLHRPQISHFIPGLSELRRVLSFGALASGVTLVQEAGWRAPELIMGRLLGFEAIGLYSRAVGLLSIISQAVIDAVQPVALPALAAKRRSGADIAGACRRALEYWWALWTSFFLFIGLMAEPAVLLLYGDQWLGAVPVVQILAFGGMFLPDIHPILAPLLMASGRLRLSLWLEVVLVPTKITMLTLGALHSLTAAMLCLAAAAVAGNAVKYMVFLGETGLRLQDVLRIGVRGWTIAAVAVLPALPVSSYGSSVDLVPFTALALAGSGFALAWLAALFVTRHPLREEITMVLAALPRLMSRWRGA